MPIWKIYSKFFFSLFFSSVLDICCYYYYNSFRIRCWLGYVCVCLTFNIHTFSFDLNFTEFQIGFTDHLVSGSFELFPKKKIIAWNWTLFLFLFMFFFSMRVKLTHFFLSFSFYLTHTIWIHAFQSSLSFLVWQFCSILFSLSCNAFDCPI